MLNKNKKGAVATTMTWVVATIVILFVIILFMIASGVFGMPGFLGKKEISPLRFPEQKQSLFAIAKNFENLDDNSLMAILEKLIEPQYPQSKRGWKLFVYENGKEKKIINSFDIIGWYDSQNFYLDLKDEKTQLRLSLECEEDVCYDNLK